MNVLGLFCKRDLSLATHKKFIRIKSKETPLTEGFSFLGGVQIKSTEGEEPFWKRTPNFPLKNNHWWLFRDQHTNREHYTQARPWVTHTHTLSLSHTHTIHTLFHTHTYQFHGCHFQDQRRNREHYTHTCPWGTHTHTLSFTHTHTNSIGSIFWVNIRIESTRHQRAHKSPAGISHVVKTHRLRHLVSVGIPYHQVTVCSKVVK